MECLKFPSGRYKSFDKIITLSSFGEQYKEKNKVFSFTFKKIAKIASKLRLNVIEISSDINII